MSHRKSRAAPVPKGGDTGPFLQGVAATARCAYVTNRDLAPAMSYWSWYTTALIERLGGVLPDLALLVVTDEGGFELGPHNPDGPDWFIECKGEGDCQWRVVTVSAESDEVLDTVLSLVAMMRATLAH